MTAVLKFTPLGAIPCGQYGTMYKTVTPTWNTMHSRSWGGNSESGSSGSEKRKRAVVTTPPPSYTLLKRGRSGNQRALPLDSQAFRREERALRGEADISPRKSKDSL